MPTMIPAGYLAKRVAPAPPWLNAPRIRDVHSMSGCISQLFADYVGYWRHNGYWLFDSPEAIRAVATEHGIALTGCALFYYEVHPRQFDGEARAWEPFRPDASFPVHVHAPREPRLRGYDVVSFAAQTGPECSPLSCNGLARRIATNAHCLLETLGEAEALLEDGTFVGCEPGPYRVFSVHTAAWE